MFLRCGLDPRMHSVALARGIDTVDLILDNLGRIGHAEIPIRPLTVFVGENNTNKTWAAYCLYGLARSLAWDWGSPSGDGEGGTRLPNVSPASVTNAVDAAARAFLHATIEDKQIASFVVDRKELLPRIRKPIEFSLAADAIIDLLRLPQDPSFCAKATLRLDRAELAAEKATIAFRNEPVRRSARVSFRSGERAFSYGFRGDANDANSLQRYIHEALVSAALRCLGPSFIFALPAERKTLVATYKFLGRAFDEVMSRPVVEFAHRLADSENVSKTAAEPVFAEALGYLHGVAGGAIAYKPAGAGVRLEYAPEGGGTVSLPMSTTSSLVRSLAGLDVYLRYWAKSGDLLIIDEPEMNAHPAAQLRITELLAYLVNKGIRVVLTTHSPYVLDHLGTLVEASRLAGGARAKIVERLRLGNEAALLSPEQLGVYRFHEDGKVASIFDPETRAIDPSTFSDVGDAETNLFSDVLAAERRHGD